MQDLMMQNEELRNMGSLAAVNTITLTDNLITAEYEDKSARTLQEMCDKVAGDQNITMTPEVQGYIQALGISPSAAETVGTVESAQKVAIVTALWVAQTMNPQEKQSRLKMSNSELIARLHRVEERCIKQASSDSEAINFASPNQQQQQRKKLATIQTFLQLPKRGLSMVPVQGGSFLTSPDKRKAPLPLTGR